MWHVAPAWSLCRCRLVNPHVDAQFFRRLCLFPCLSPSLSVSLTLPVAAHTKVTSCQWASAMRDLHFWARSRSRTQKKATRPCWSLGQAGRGRGVRERAEWQRKRKRERDTFTAANKRQQHEANRANFARVANGAGAAAFVWHVARCPRLQGDARAPVASGSTEPAAKSKEAATQRGNKKRRRRRRRRRHSMSKLETAPRQATSMSMT